MEGRNNNKHWLETRLAEANTDLCEVISPYFDENNLPERIKNINSQRVILYLSKDNGFYNIRRSIYNELKQSDYIEFYQLVADEKNAERFVHAKLIKNGNSLIIGSYNFTEAALCGKNAEAAIIYNKVNALGFQCDPDIDESAFLDDDEIINNQDSLLSSTRVYITVTVDWLSKKMIINLNAGDVSCSNYIITIGNTTINVSDQVIEKSIYEEDLENELLVNKQFILYKSGKQIYIGRINELGWIQCRPELSCKNLNDALSEWYSVNNGKSKDDLPIQYEVQSLTGESDVYDAASLCADSDKDIFDNYYYMSTAMRGMITALKSAKEYQEKYRIFVTSPGSMKRLLNFIEKEMDETKEIDYANLWMILLFLDEAYQLLPENMRSLPNYSEEKELFRIQLENCTSHCKESLYQLSNKKRQFGRYLNWIESEFGTEQ